jgi:hypothetical protein
MRHYMRHYTDGPRFNIFPTSLSHFSYVGAKLLIHKNGSGAATKNSSETSIKHQMLRIEPHLALIIGVLLANRVLIFRFQLLTVYVLLVHNCGECRIASQFPPLLTFELILKNPLLHRICPIARIRYINFNTFFHTSKHFQIQLDDSVRNFGTCISH